MIDDIKLPPLPYPQIPGNDYTAEDMQAYARAAIKADRQQCEGGPVKEIELRAEDLSTSTYSPTPRPQWVAHTDRGVRVVHLPTGLMAECHEERSPHRNREIALAKLKEMIAAEPVSVRLLIQAKEFLEGHCDEGPDGEGWKSDDLETLITEIEVAIAAPQPAEQHGEPVAWRKRDGEWRPLYEGPQPATLTQQYYYSMTGCKADKPTAPDCICWHDKGTGPFPERKEGDEVGGFPVSWRDKPSAPAQEPSVPEGWKLVPVEPTKEMRDVITSGIRHDHMVSVYQAMIEAAPKFGEEE